MTKWAESNVIWKLYRGNNPSCSDHSARAFWSEHHSTTSERVCWISLVTSMPTIHFLDFNLAAFVHSTLRGQKSAFTEKNVRTRPHNVLKMDVGKRAYTLRRNEYTLYTLRFVYAVFVGYWNTLAWNKPVQQNDWGSEDSGCTPFTRRSRHAEQPALRAEQEEVKRSTVKNKGRSNFM